MNEDYGEMPLRANGIGYRHEMICEEGSRHHYADCLTDFLPVLISGYADLADPVDRATARARHAVQVQLTLQERINSALGMEDCTPEQVTILTGDRAMQPPVRLWSASVPLLLVDVFYAPFTAMPQPVVVVPGEIFWLTPSEETAYLWSLASLDVVTFVDRYEISANTE